MDIRIRKPASDDANLMAIGFGYPDAMSHRRIAILAAPALLAVAALVAPTEAG